MIMYCIEDTRSICGEFKFEAGKKYSFILSINPIDRNHFDYRLINGSTHIPNMPNRPIITKGSTGFFLPTGVYTRRLQDKLKGLLV